MPAHSIRERAPKPGYDLIVLGSGAAGLSTAVSAAQQGLNVAVFEKSGLIGGTSAWSGGWMWIPRNRYAEQAGIKDSVEQIKTYLSAVAGGEPLDPRVDTFIEQAPQMLDHYLATTELDFIDGNLVPDFQDLPGSLSGGRSVCAKPFDASVLGKSLRYLRPPRDIYSVMGMGIGSFELRMFYDVLRKPKAFIHVSQRFIQHFLELARFRRSVYLLNGSALIGRLYKSALDLGVEIFVDVDVQAINQAEGRVSSITVKDKKIQTGALVSAAGGFPNAPDIQAKQFPQRAGNQHFSAAIETNDGKATSMIQQLGGQLAKGFSQPAAWAPTSEVVRADGSKAYFAHLLERGKPGMIAVGPDAKRFTNEANSYHMFYSALFATYEMDNPHCWLIADAKAYRRWGMGWAKPFPFLNLQALKSGYLIKGASIEALAAKINLDPTALKTSIERFNRFAEQGKDEDFQRGESRYNKGAGDFEHGPNPSLGKLTQGPFYAVKLLPGSLGTFAGIETNQHCEVLNAQGNAIPGLYAVGNEAASIFRGQYPSGGITLGPAMTFGYIAGKAVANYLRTQED